MNKKFSFLSLAPGLELGDYCSYSAGSNNSNYELTTEPNASYWASVCMGDHTLPSGLAPVGKGSGSRD